MNEEMDNEVKTKIAITSGIIGVILLMLVLFLALSGKNSAEKDDVSEYISVIDDSEKKEESISENTSSEDASKDSSEKSSEESGEQTKEDNSEAVIGKKDNTISGNNFYETKTPSLKKDYKGVTFDRNAQLEEMLGYWRDGNQDAVRDLAHLERFEAMSATLSGTKDFYYFGDKDDDGNPNGTGIAVYADNQYYYGEWSKGKRSGKGTWFAFYPEYDNYVVKEHMYSGQFADDLPNGEGQEHYDYNQEYMNEEDVYLQNAIGKFSNGYYNGDMYIITVNKNLETREWVGICENGKWKQIPNSKKDDMKRVPVLDEKDNPENHFWMWENKVENNGITGYIYGGNLK